MELAQQRLRFVPRLITAAGYAGWVLLLDEVDLVARYSVMQHGRSYAELARWLGLGAEKVPGVVAWRRSLPNWSPRLSQAPR